MIQLYVAAVVFVGLHLLVAGTRLRGLLVGRMGEGAYMGAFSLLSVATLAWLIWAFAQARGTAGDLDLWPAYPWRKHVALALVLLGFLLVVPGLLTANPTSVKGEGTLQRGDPAKGMVRITRHPFLWGVAIWAAAHLLTNGDLASLVLFASMLVLGLTGPPSIDAKRRAALGETYAAFQRQTSSVPFAAILAGRQRLSLGEIGWWRIAAALAAFAVMLWLHPRAFGASPLT